MTKATRRMRAPHEPSDHSSQVGSASEHPLKLDIDERSPSHPESRLASLSLCLHPETGSKTKSSKPEVLKNRSAKESGSHQLLIGLADRAGVLWITYSRPGNQDAVPRGGARPCKIDRGSLPEKDVFAARAVRHPSALESLQRGRWLRAHLGRRTQADTSHDPWQKLGLRFHVRSPPWRTVSPRGSA